MSIKQNERQQANAVVLDYVRLLKQALQRCLLIFTPVEGDGSMDSLSAMCIIFCITLTRSLAMPVQFELPT